MKYRLVTYKGMLRDGISHDCLRCAMITKHDLKCHLNENLHRIIGKKMCWDGQSYYEKYNEELNINTKVL